MALRHTRNYHKDWYKLDVPHVRSRGQRVDVPDDIEQRDFDPSPCFACGVRADVACRHRFAS